MSPESELNDLCETYSDQHVYAYIRYNNQIIRVETRDRDGKSDLCILHHTNRYTVVWRANTATKIPHYGPHHLLKLDDIDIDILLKLFKQFIQDSEDRIHVAADGNTTTFCNIMEKK